MTDDRSDPKKIDDAERPFPPLAPHQLKVAKLLCEGDLTYAVIGDRLGLTESTVKTYVHEMRVKYQIGSSRHLVAFLIRSGLLDDRSEG